MANSLLLNLPLNSFRAILSCQSTQARICTSLQAQLVCVTIGQRLEFSNFHPMSCLVLRDKQTNIVRFSLRLRESLCIDLCVGPAPLAHSQNFFLIAKRETKSKLPDIHTTRTRDCIADQILFALTCVL